MIRRPGDKKLRASRAKKTRLVVQVPDLIGTMDSNTVTAPLYSHGYSSEVWAQIVQEWRAKGAIIFTPGNGDAGIAAVCSETPTLLLAVSPEHTELLSFFIDCATATSIQVEAVRVGLAKTVLVELVAFV